MDILYGLTWRGDLLFSLLHTHMDGHSCHRFRPSSRIAFGFERAPAFTLPELQRLHAVFAAQLGRDC
jgi:hypothetical protein